MIVRPQPNGYTPYVNPPKIPYGCLLWLDMQDMGDKIIDRSDKGNHGISTGSISASASIGYGQARKFDGIDDFVIGTSNLGISGDAEFTLQAWVYWNGAFIATFPGAIGNNSTGTTGRGLSMNFADGRPALDFWSVRVRATNAIIANQWTHITAVKKPGLISTTTKLYVNGIEVSWVGEGTDTNPNIIDSTFLVGTLQNAATRFFSGSIGISKVFNRALMEPEIRTQFASEAWRYGVSS